MDAATLVLTLTLAGTTREEYSAHPSLKACEVAGRAAVQMAPPGATVTYTCRPHLKVDTNLYGQTTGGAR